MNVFGTYSKYYNLLYKDKDYAGEAQFVHELLQTHSPGTKTILDLGCGTGRHDFLLAEKGYAITGVDRSEEMLMMANKRLCSTSNLSFIQGDIRTLNIGEQFDAVISLFHVMSYQTSNEDLKAAFSTVKRHLTPGGIFIFDCWYGPGVLSDRPSVRIKRLEDEEIVVTRIAEPVMHPNENLVDVNYLVFVKNKGDGSVEEIRETHTMRYLFKPEIESLFEVISMKYVGCYEWLTNHEPGQNTWRVYFIGKA
ncbi:MAG TPA: class I SAM-dependent methyltransferase [Thermodesulfovibrionales bacterium]|nr:class I SAM-dependent methyltransferase [Thermodesulfovibrionales bacterium]